MVARRPNGVEGTSISGDHGRVRPTHGAPRAASGRPTSSRLCRSCKIPWQILKRDFAALLSQPMAASAAVGLACRPEAPAQAGRNFIGVAHPEDLVHWGTLEVRASGRKRLRHRNEHRGGFRRAPYRCKKHGLPSQETRRPARTVTKNNPPPLQKTAPAGTATKSTKTSNRPKKHDLPTQKSRSPFRERTTSSTSIISWMIHNTLHHH